MLNVIIELVVSFAQYFSTIVNIPEINFPESWKVPIRYVATINVGLDSFSSWFPALTDIRVYFMFLSVVGPLVFVIAGLLFLNEKRVVLWYLMVVMGVMLTLAGGLGRIVAATTDLSITPETAQLLLYAGLADLVAMAVIFLIAKRCSKEDDTQVVQRTKVMDEETKSISIFSTVQSFVIFVAFSALAVLCWGYGTKSVQDQVDSVGNSFAVGLSGICVLFAFVFLVWFIMGLSQAGRRKQWAFHSWFESGFLRVLLLTISLAYIPIGAGVFLMFNCNNFSCPNASRLPDDGSSIFANSTSLSSNDYCVSCIPAASQLCPTPLLNSMCIGSSGSRLEYSISTECSNVRSFFWPAAALIIVMFVLGVPAMFYSLIEVSSSTLHKEFPIKEIKPPLNDPDFDLDRAKWHKQVIQSRNVAKFLFQPFQYNYRFVRLFLVVQKLLIVSTTSYVIRGSVADPQMIALVCSIVIHFFSFLLLAYYQPFVAAFEARVAIMMSLCLTVACVISILLLKGVTIPTVVMYVIIAINGLLPCIAIGFGLYLEWSSGKADDEEQEKEAMTRLSAEMDKKLEAEQQREQEALNGPLQITTTTTLPGTVPEMEASTSQRANFGLLPIKETAEEKRRRNMRRLRLNQEAKLKVKDDIERENLKLNDGQGDVDLFIDRAVKSRLQMFLMVAGVIGAVALSLCLIGLITREQTAVLGPFPATRTIASELAGYASWNDFRTNCCCTQNTNPAQGGSYRLIEKWMCMNGKIKERVREIETSSGVFVDGFSVRSYCSVDFASDCTLNVAAAGTVSASCTGARTNQELLLW